MIEAHPALPISKILSAEGELLAIILGHYIDREGRFRWDTQDSWSAEEARKMRASVAEPAGRFVAIAIAGARFGRRG